jgi:hypothetical protein
MNLKARPRVERRYKHKVSKQQKHVYPDDELEFVMERGGPGIDSELVLGTGTDKLIVAPMRPGETLLQVVPGKTESYATTFTDTAKKIAVRSCPNDVGNQQPALFPNGSRRPAMPLNPQKVWLANKPFVDNFIFLANFNNQATILDFLKCFGLTKEGNPPPTKRISVKGARKDKKLETQEWKVAAADVPIEDIAFVCLLYKYGREEWDGELVTLAEWAKENWQHHQDRIGMPSDSLVLAVTLAHSRQFYIVDIDLTVDLPGTLHAKDFEKAVKLAGHTVLKSKCGLQCIKFTPHRHERQKHQNHRVVAKVYNKVCETLQQGFARKGNTACKVAKLSSPSTAGLNAKTLDEEYNLNGITRLELTYRFAEGAWTFEEMFKVLDCSLELLKNCLVRASFQDHLAGMEPFLKGSTVTYYPEVFEHAKLQFMRLKDKKKNGALYKTMYPSGSVHRWINSHTGKMNGLEVHGNVDGRETHSTGWTSVCLAAAACCNSGENPTLFVCVGGVEKWLDPQPDSLKCLYFRQVTLDRHAVHPKMRLLTYFVGPSKNSYPQVNVNPDDLLLNPAIISALSKAEIQTEISIPSEFCPDDLLPTDTCSEAVENFTGIAKGIKGANEYNMPVEPSHWTDLKIGYSGQNRTEKLKFKFKGQWFWLPKKWEALVREHVLGRTNVNCTFRWGPSGFVCAVEDTTDAAPVRTSEDTLGESPRCSAKPTPIHIGAFAAASDIPISINGHEIQSGGFVKRKGTEPSCFLSLRGFVERFWIPKSLADRLYYEAKKESGQSNLAPSDYSLDGFLAGCRLIKPDNDLIRVSGNRNIEQRMWIVTDTDELLVEQQETSRSKGKREASNSVDGGSSKRQRTT